MADELDESRILSALRDSGYEAESISALRSSGVRYRAAIPLLVEELSRSRDPRVLEDIVRALSVPWASPLAIGPLIHFFQSDISATPPSLRWVVGNALAVLWSDQFFDELSSLALDERYGKAREMIVLGMAKSRRVETTSLLVRLSNDDVTSGHAVRALRKLGDPKAKETFERMLSDKRAWVRGDARAALAALQKKISTSDKAAD